MSLFRPDRSDHGPEVWPIEGMLTFEMVLRCMECGWHGYSQISAYFHLTHQHPALLAQIAIRNKSEDESVPF
jgi:hypothetical protein